MVKYFLLNYTFYLIATRMFGKQEIPFQPSRFSEAGLNIFSGYQDDLCLLVGT